MSDLREQLQTTLGSTYTIERELGGGGMSRLFLAQERALDRQVVIKVLSPELAAGGVNLDRFKREIQLAARLQHPHIVPVLGAGDTNGIPFYIMPYVEGESLRARIESQGELPVEEATRTFREVVDALEYAHEHGIVHRDIKPENILITGRHAVVTDFGVARALSVAADDAKLTGTGLAIGTPAYMAPEQASGDVVDHRADIYAAGLVAYEMFAGRHPFAAVTPQRMLAAHAIEPVPPLAKRRSAVSPGLAAIVDRCVAKSPADRWQSASDLRRALEAVDRTGTTPIPIERRSSRRLSSSVLVGAAVLIALAAVGVAIAFKPRTVVAPSAADLVVVLPFRVSASDPSLTILREGMLDLLAAKLTGEAGPRAVDVRSVMSAWQRAGGTERRDLDFASAVALTRDLGARRLLMGSIVGSPARFTATASMTDTRDTSRVIRAEATGPLDSLVPIVDRLVATLLVSQAGVRETGTLTASLPALMEYLAGQQAHREGRYDDAGAHHRRALARDTGFALAAAGLVEAGIWTETWDPAAIRDGKTAAWRLRGKLSARDWAVIEPWFGSRYPTPPTIHQQIEALERLTQVYPDRVEGWFALGDRLVHYGSYIGIRNTSERAEEAFRRAIALDSSYAPALEHLADGLILRRDSGAVKAVAAYIDQAPRAEGINSYHWTLARLQGDTAALRQSRAAFDTLPALDLHWVVLWSQFVEGAGEDRRRALGVLRNRTRTPDGEGVRRMLAQYEASDGRPSASARNWRSLRDDDPHGKMEPVFHALLDRGDSVLAGDLAEAGLAIAGKAAPSIAAARLVHVRRLCGAGLWMQAQRNTAAAERVRRALEAVPVSDDTSGGATYTAPLCVSAMRAIGSVDEGGQSARSDVSRLDSLTVSLFSPATDDIDFGVLAGVLWRRIGDDASARRALERQALVTSSFTMMTARLRELGHARLATGDTLGALESWRHYLRNRPDPEPSVAPETNEIRALVARLERARM